MPFQANTSIISTDLDNMLRGMYRDNSDHAITGTVVETDMATFLLTANTMGPTGELVVHFSGSFTGAAGLKTVKLYFGGTLILSLTTNSVNDVYWNGDVRIINTSAAAQRVAYRISCAPVNGVVSSHIAATALIAKDTTANQIIKLTAQNVNAADTTTQQTFDVMVVQIQ